MKIVVIGIGYVGTAVAAKLAEVGNIVVGVDVDPQKVDSINNGQSPLVGDEPRLSDLIAEVHREGRLSATSDYSVCSEMDVIILAVETPFDTRRKRPLYFALRNALGTLSLHICPGQLIVVESTLAPNTTDSVVRPILERGSNLKAGKDFNLSHAPERVMPGRLLLNLETLDRVVGGVTEECATRAKKFYQQITEGTIDTTTNLMAEMVKTTENAYRDVQIAFANEIALLVHTLELDAFDLRTFVNKVPDRHMHLPGAGVGGHCIPKDSWLLAYGARGKFRPQLLIDAREVNDSMPHYVANLCEESLEVVGKSTDECTVSVLGVSFLENSGDTRQSPTVTLVADLEIVRCGIALHDPFVPKLGGRKVLQDVNDAVQGTDAVIIMTKHREYNQLGWKAIATLMRPNPVLIDGRNVVSRGVAEEAGFLYQGVGKYISPNMRRIPERK